MGQLATSFTTRMRQLPETAVSLKDFAGLFFALALVALAALLLFGFSWTREDADNRFDHTREVYRTSQMLLLSSAQANTNARNFIMTKNNKYLEQYKASKIALRQEVNALINLTHSPVVHSLATKRLAPDLEDFLNASDKLVGEGATASLFSRDGRAQKNSAERNELELVALQDQESACAVLNATMDEVQLEELKILQMRKDSVQEISNRIATLRGVILTVAFLAVLISIFTLQTVVKKDRQKIESLEEAVSRTMQAQQQASDALAAMRKSNELKTQFMSNISHEIRTPMTGILGLADLLCASNLAQPADRYAQVLLNSSQQLLNVLNDLLNFAQLEKKTLSLDKQPFAIRQTIKDVVAWGEHDAREKNLQLSATVDDGVPEMVTGDEERIRQVILTFVSNALKFTNDGGVQISVQSLEKGVIKIAVIDTGIGIGDKDLDKLFLPFVQIDGGIRRTRGGNGLSLTISKHLVALMSGEIGVLSETGSGSIFWFTFAGGQS